MEQPPSRVGRAIPDISEHLCPPPVICYFCLQMKTPNVDLCFVIKYICSNLCYPLQTVGASQGRISSLLLSLRRERRAIELYKQLKPRSPDNAYSDSTEMVRIIVQTVQGQDRVLKELFGHLSKLLGCKQKIIDLLPRIEMALNHIKEADCSLMLMQAKRQREIWHLLKIACTQSSARSLGSASLETPIIPRTPAWPDQSSPQTLSSMLMPKEKDREAFSRMIEENQTYLSQFHTLLQEAKQEQQSGVTSLDWSWMNQ
ncbi:hypothetical protein FKM82_018874 [Ascaphus truei]